MAINISGAGSITYVPMEYVFKIKQPEMVENEYTVNDDEAAREIMKNVGIVDLDGLKSLLEGLDMTSISTRELSSLCAGLNKLGFNDVSAYFFLAEGNEDSGFDGRSRNLDVKFNAIPLVYEKLQGQIDFAATEGLKGDKAYGRILSGIANANHIVAALSYFVKTAHKLPSINEQA
ncbi:hypothetical protein K3169_01985 [Pseudomonas phytophila]|uniref:Uncharacterized protein n=1 Tax=Pseudomonas phytophila TaxID=2867264 RepID=A0ABY6FFP1_9PSED|nr:MULTISPECIES: hypothetical protein [Pseudomonas]PHN31857.1 hypothetical protein AO242_13915 [Pseudomonas sp. ICMP 561]UXZ96707.1 hypothetical protein K3169_01985 [Pseudomonas phytophila]